MNLDFAFRDDRGRVVLAGWSYVTEPDLVIASGGAESRVEVIARFRRADLGSAPLGLLAVADDVPESEPDSGPRLTGQADIDLTPYLAAGDGRLIAQALDETVEALMRAIALGQVGSLSPTASAALLSRARATATSFPLESVRLAIGVDRALLAPGGLGVVIGWSLTDTATENPIVGLVLDGKGVFPLPIASGSLRRPDLEAYGRRYHVGGHDGFAAAFRTLPGEAGQGTSLVMMSADAGRSSGLSVRTFDMVTDDRVAEEVAACLDLMTAATSRATLLGALAAAPPSRAARPPALPAPGRAPIGEGTVIALVADTDAADLRDILRRVVPAYDWPVEVRIVGDATPPAAAAAIEAAAAELQDMPPRLEGTGPSGAARPNLTLGEALSAALLTDLTLPPGVTVVYGLASAMAQLGLPQAQPDRAEAVVWDPLAGLGDALQVRAGDLIAQPLVAAMPGAMFTAMLAGPRPRALTAVGVIGAALGTLLAADRLAVRRATTGAYWPGTRGSIAAARIDAAMVELDG